jgi:hypothetical protein
MSAGRPALSVCVPEQDCAGSDLGTSKQMNYTANLKY